MYYAFFAPKEFKGEVELRGLKPGFYTVVDYVDGKELGRVDAVGGVARMKVEFKEHLLLEGGAGEGVCWGPPGCAQAGQPRRLSLREHFIPCSHARILCGTRRRGRLRCRRDAS